MLVIEKQRKPSQSI